MLVAEKLRELGIASAGVETKTCSGEATELMDAWGTDDEVIIVDAVVTGTSAGTLHRWDGGVPHSVGGALASTHGFGVGEAIRLARALGRSPKSLRVFGIEGRQFDRGTEISPEVKQAVEDVVQQIRAEIRALHCQ